MFPILLLLMSAVTGTQSADEVAVRQLFSHRATAWEQQDVAGLVDPFTADSDYVDSSGNLTVGKQQIAENYKKIFASGILSNSSSSQSITKIRFVRPDVAIVDATWTLEGLKGPNGTALPNREGMSVIIVTKEGDDWKIASLRGMRAVPQEAHN